MTILIKCLDREIVVLGTFENEDLAWNAMALDLSKEMDMKNIPDNWYSIKEYTRGIDFDITPLSAWLNRRGDHDWRIVTEKELGEINGRRN